MLLSKRVALVLPLTFSLTALAVAGCSQVDRTAEIRNCERQVQEELAGAEVRRGPLVNIRFEGGSFQDTGGGTGRITGEWKARLDGAVLMNLAAGEYTCSVGGGLVTPIDISRTI
jgi:hypothetical protein